MIDELTGIYLVTVQLADGRTLEYSGAEDEYTDWLGELRSVETVVNLDGHELTEAELEAYGPIMDSPGTSPEEATRSQHRPTEVRSPPGAGPSSCRSGAN